VLFFCCAGGGGGGGGGIGRLNGRGVTPMEFRFMPSFN